ncbi:hypothetical protein [Streptomyces sp. NBC_00102]|uniref:hypothetical protein n=1 Tax=Streptomyces sp. NBC_00102 TaxID=2975652 RepID=UPI0022581AB5|nr:hypothetical protein [Streptomyces sp. NBC_00102]MCX5397449.1 hypothetical protein [Streptomyces sp. NBC_00102]
MSFALLLTTAAATAVGAAAVHTARGLHRQVAGLREDLARDREHTRTVPAQSRTGAAPAEIRAAVSEALAEERERELAEARAFWAAQEARDAADAPSLLGGLTGLGEDAPYFLPRQADFAGLEALAFPFAEEADETGETAYAAHPAVPVHPDDAVVADAMREFSELMEPAEPGEAPASREVAGPGEEPGTAEYADDSPELAAARRRHPSHPDFVPVRTPVITDHERTVNRLEELALTGTGLTDVRPGPLGTLDVYVFADGTTLCMTPGHRETAERLADSLRAGEQPFLLGGSGVSGAYALTFSCGAENVYILADRVIASF